MSDKFGKYDICAVAGSAYCYPDSNVLRNRLNIRDGATLRRAEADISSARQTEMLLHPIAGRFTVTHLCNIHRQLLGDVYPFAGYFRREDIAKGETRFVAHGEINTKLTRLLAELREEHRLDGYDSANLIKRGAYYMAELNYIHPFREGNGRATREFMRLLFLRSDCLVDWSAVTVDELMQAMVDSIYDTEHLERVLEKCVTQK